MINGFFQVKLLKARRWAENITLRLPVRFVYHVFPSQLQTCMTVCMSEYILYMNIPKLLDIDIVLLPNESVI